jgi:hypothetical protein
MKSYAFQSGKLDERQKVLMLPVAAAGALKERKKAHLRRLSQV